MPSLSLSDSQTGKRFFWIFTVLSIGLFNLGVAADSPLPVLIPLGIVFALFCVHSVKNLYYLFFFLLPFSIEVELPNGFGTDLPSEPLMLLLTGITIIIYIKSFRQISGRIMTHPISILLLVHLFWILFTTLFSTDQFISLKFFLAKIWYLCPFYFLPLIILRDTIDYRRLFYFLIGGTLLAITYVLINHAGEGFSFASSNKVVRPIFRNHVNYAIMLLAVFPFLISALFRTKRHIIIKSGVLLFFLVAIYLTYTRAAQLSLVLAIGIFFVIKYRLAKLSIGLGLILMILLTVFLCTDNRYLDYAPDYEKAIVHKKFDNLVEATTKMQDISTVERFYRWVAGFYMVGERPWTGFGPARFYFEYRPHTVTSYKTYVSDNPEKSGIHNYYLMTTVEQGIPGLIILLAIIIVTVLIGEQTVHRLSRKEDKNLVYAAIVCFVLICIVILINDLLEADKVGPFFFLSAAIITHYSLSKGPEIQESADLIKKR